jgi:hypothetical protein
MNCSLKQAIPGIAAKRSFPAKPLRASKKESQPANHLTRLSFFLSLPMKIANF